MRQKIDIGDLVEYDNYQALVLDPKTIKIENCSPLFLGAKGEIYTPGYYTIQNLCGLSNELLYIRLAQRAAKSSSIKVDVKRQG